MSLQYIIYDWKKKMSKRLIFIVTSEISTERRNRNFYLVDCEKTCCLDSSRREKKGEKGEGGGFGRRGGEEEEKGKHW